LPAYFFDSSALVKRYHIELGTPAVLRMIDGSKDAILISRLAVAETISAFAIQVRMQAISWNDADAFQRRFRIDIATGRFEVFSITDAEVSIAELLLSRHAFNLRLRALDALQLAVAMALRTRGLVDHFVSADRTLCEVAVREGFQVINPEGI
jgi:uncharacterized protein